MGATSVTGLSGNGDSHGLYKEENHCGGCGCGCAGDEEESTPTRSVGCYIPYRSGGNVSVQSGGSLSVQGC